MKSMFKVYIYTMLVIIATVSLKAMYTVFHMHLPTFKHVLSFIIISLVALVATLPLVNILREKRT